MMSNNSWLNLAFGTLLTLAGTPSAFAGDLGAAPPVDASQAVNRPSTLPLPAVPNYSEKLKEVLAESAAATSSTTAVTTTPAPATGNSAKVTPASQVNEATTQLPAVQQPTQPASTSHAAPASGYTYPASYNQGRRRGLFQRFRRTAPAYNGATLPVAQSSQTSFAGAFRVSSLPGGSVIQTAMRDAGMDLGNPTRTAMMLTVPYYPLVSAGFNVVRNLLVR